MSTHRLNGHRHNGNGRSGNGHNGHNGHQVEKAKPRRVTWGKAEEDLILALKLGKGHAAAAAIAGFEKASQSQYRCTKAKEMGLYVSPLEWRKSTDFGGMSLNVAKHRLKDCDRILKQIDNMRRRAGITRRVVRPAASSN